MAIRKLIKTGDPRLKAKNKPIRNFFSKTTKKVIKDLIDTMRKEELVGMAAPQIGENYQVFVTEVRNTPARKVEKPDKVRVYVNPKIIKTSRKQSSMYEGCGCLTDLFGPITRPWEVTVQAIDENGVKFQLTADGLLGRAILHEYDHLQGIEFIEKSSDYTKLKDKQHYISQIKTSKPQLAAQKITKIDFKYL